MAKSPVAHRRPRRPLFGSLLLLAAGVTAAAVPLAVNLTAASAASAIGIYKGTEVPATPAESDTAAVDLGVVFKVSVPGNITALRYYKASTNTGSHTGALWSAAGAKLASVTFTNEGKSGWQTATLATPVSVVPGTTYTASYHAPAGHYAQQTHVFDSGRTIGASSIVGVSGTYHYGTTVARPTQTWQNSAYFVDALFQPSGSTSGTVSSSSAPPVSLGQGALATTRAAAPSTVTTSSAPAPAQPTTTQATSSAAAPVTSSSAAPVSTATSSSAAAPVTSSSSTAAPASGWPAAGNTGVPAGTALTAVPGQATSGSGWTWNSGGYVQVTKANVTLSGLDIQGSVVDNYSGLTMVNSKIRCDYNPTACLVLGSSSSVTDTEIGGGDNGSTYTRAFGVWSGGSSSSNVLTRVNIHHVIHGLHIDGGTTVQDSWIHDIPMGDPGFESDHTDGVFVSTGQNIVFRHNSFSGANNSLIFVQDYDNTAEGVGNLTIDNNLFTATNRNGEVPSYGVGIENKDIKGSVTVTNNVFTKGFQVAAIEIPSSGTYSGNTWSDGSKASVSVS